MRTTVLLLVMALTLGLAAGAVAWIGDYRVVQGTIALWPQEPFAYGVAMVQGEDGARYFVRFTPVTSSPAGLRQGDVVTILGRESFSSTEIDALTVERRTQAMTEGWRTLTGTIDSMSGSTMILKVPSGRSIAIDMSQMPGDQSRALMPGQDVTVTGLLRNPTLLTAHGMATGGEVPAALPR